MASMESRLILGGCSRNLFFQMEMGVQTWRGFPSHNMWAGISRADFWQTKQKRVSRVGGIQSSLLRFSWTLTASGQVVWCLHLFIQQSEFAKSQLECK